MSDGEPSAREKRFEIFSTVLLAVATLAAAWSGYQAALWDGIQSSDYSQASAMRVESTLALGEAGQDRLADLSVLENYIDATFAGDTAQADFYRSHARDEFKPALEAWIALDPFNNPDAPNSPLAMDQYELEHEQEGIALAKEAHDTFETGENANTTSDIYVLTTLFFASVLFLAAVSERIEWSRLRWALLGTASLIFVVGTILALTQRVTSPG